MGNAVGVIDLIGESAFDALVGVESVTYPGDTLVIPGDADASFLMQRLLNELGGAGSLGEPTLLGEGIQWSPLPDNELAVIRNWIESGANRCWLATNGGPQGWARSCTFERDVGPK